MIWEIIASFFCALFGTCESGECRTLNYLDTDHIICSYAVESVSVRLYLNDAQNAPFARLENLEKTLEQSGTHPLMLMNGGMYHADLGAVGLHIEDGSELKPVSTKGGWGNFHLLPNGVFWGQGDKVGVTETKAFIAQNRSVDFATQSGPMLVIDGKLHPRFLKNSDSTKIRNGVGITRDGKTVHFVISRRPVTFWNFGKLFQEELGSHNALFLDGTVSAIKTPQFSQSGWRSLGPMIGVFKR